MCHIWSKNCSYHHWLSDDIWKFGKNGLWKKWTLEKMDLEKIVLEKMSPSLLHVWKWGTRENWSVYRSSHIGGK